MINLQRLKYLKENNANDSIQFVAQYILEKLQRDKSEFSRYSYDDDWSELDHYIHSLNRTKRPRDLKILREMALEISDTENVIIKENNFEKTLRKHLNIRSL